MSENDGQEPRDLRLIGRTEDGTHLELADRDGATFQVRISDTLRATINQPRLTPVTDEPQEVMTIKEIQRRLRAGETMDAIARLGNISVEKVERFAGPVLQERTFIISQAEKTPLRKDSHALTLGDAVQQRLAPLGVNMELVQWNASRKDDGSWLIVCSYPNRDGAGNASWNFDSAKRTLSSVDDGARWISGEEQPKPPRQENGFVANQGTTDHREPPRLVAVRTTPTESEPEKPATPVASQETLDIEPDAKRDGVKRRISIPSWDDIMFGKKNKDEE
ncbi:MAG: septation protein SepH [Candidatus Nanopelagicaceae bacterium]|jgi:hypothetical protein